MRKNYLFLMSAILVGLLHSFVWQVYPVDVQGVVGKYSSIAVDELNRIHISYYDSTNGNLKYALYDGNIWKFETVDGIGSGNPNVGKWTSIAIGPNNLPHIAYYDVTNTNLKYAHFNGTNWVIETVDGAGTAVGQYTSIFVDQNGIPHISYFDATNTALKYAYKVTTNWIIETVDNSADVGRFTSISGDLSGIIHISYNDRTNNSLKYAYGTYGNWNIQSVISNQYGSYTSLALGLNNTPFISHRKYGGGGSEGLVLSFRSGTTWVLRYIDLPANNSILGRGTSIEYDKINNRIWIAYYNGDQGNLKLASSSDYPNFNTWNVINLDTTGNVGITPSIALTIFRTPIISYFDSTNGDLKVAELKDTTPPAAPRNLTANGGRPSPWSKEGVFILHWINPTDETGIRRALYKIYNFPQSNFDTTGTLRPNAPDTVVVVNEGIIPLYLWLQDYSGNLNYKNYDSVYLRHDKSLPVNSKVKISKKFVNTSSFIITWTKGEDRGNPPSGIKGYNVYYRDGNGPWVIWLSNHPDTEEVLYGIDGHKYFFEVTAIDSAGNEETRTFVAEDTLIFDLTAPSPPQNLLANGASPSPWTNTPNFVISWSEPEDTSDIKRRLYKLFSPPVSNYDTTGTFHKSPDTITISNQGIVPLYLWFEDSASNVDYNRRGFVNLRFDATSPTNSKVKIDVKTTNQSTFLIHWTKGLDNLSGIKSYSLYYKVKGSNWSLYRSNIKDTFTDFNFTLTDTLYYFEVVAVDSAGNVENLVGLPEDSVFYDVKAPQAPTNLLANGSNPSYWTNINFFSITWVEPFDRSGIKDRYYKLGFPPQHNFDTTGTFHKSPDTVKVSLEGVTGLYLWLGDSTNNVQYTNYSSVFLRYDTTKPFNARCSIPQFYINQPTFTLSWTRAHDNLSGIKFYEVYYKYKHSNWTLYADSLVDTFVLFNAFYYDTVYYFEVISVDSAGNREVISGVAEDSVFVGTLIPLPPSNLLANGSNPSPWTKDTVFVLTWDNPHDPTGIIRAFYKLGSRPQHNFDTTGSLRGIPPDTVYTKVEGGVKLHLWLMNGLYNLDYRSTDSVLLRHDRTSPSGSKVQIPLYSTNDTAIITWTEAQDQGGSGLKGYDVYYKVQGGNWNILVSDTISLSTIFVGSDGKKYYFEAISKDSASNFEQITFLPEDSIIFDLTSPTIISISPPHGSVDVPPNTNILIRFSEKLNRSTVIDTNFQVIGKTSGSHSFALFYDSLTYTVTLDPHLNFSSQETVFVRISQNIKDLAGNLLQGQREFFFITMLRPDTQGPVSISSINPISPEPYNYLDINVIVSDTGRGNSIISYAEMFIDNIGPSGTGIPLLPIDGSFDESIEELTKKIDLSTFNFKSGETHFIYVHAKDINNIYGEYDTIKFTVSPDDDSIPPSFKSFTQGYINPGTSFYVKGVINDLSGVYDDETGSKGQGVYLLWDYDGEVDNSYYEIQLQRIRGDTFISVEMIPGLASGEVVYRVFAHDNDFDTYHPGDRKKGQSELSKVIFGVPMVVNFKPYPDVIFIGDSLLVEITSNIPFREPPICSLITFKGSLKERIELYSLDRNHYKGKISTSGADVGIARVIAYYKEYGTLKRLEDTVMIKAKGEFLPENTVYVWPNPVKDYGNFHFYINQNAKVTVEIFDIRGKKVAESSGIFKGGIEPHTLTSNSLVIDLRGLAPGLYMFRLVAEAIDTNERKMVIKKFAIVR
ncbi:MAG: Ig-like domain-containing protein [Candidatus Hydrothermales bacterium]